MIIAVAYSLTTWKEQRGSGEVDVTADFPQDYPATAFAPRSVPDGSCCRPPHFLLLYNQPIAPAFTFCLMR